MNNRFKFIPGLVVIVTGFLFGIMIQQITTKETNAVLPGAEAEADAMFEKNDDRSDYSEKEMIRAKTIAEKASGKEMVFKNPDMIILLQKNSISTISKMMVCCME